MQCRDVLNKLVGGCRCRQTPSYSSEERGHGHALTLLRTPPSPRALVPMSTAQQAAWDSHSGQTLLQVRQLITLLSVHCAGFLRGIAVNSCTETLPVGAHTHCYMLAACHGQGHEHLVTIVQAQTQLDVSCYGSFRAGLRAPNRMGCMVAASW